MSSTGERTEASPPPRWLVLAALAAWIPTAAYLTLADSVPRSLHGGLNSWLGHVGIGFAITLTALWSHRAIDPTPSPAARVRIIGASIIFLAGTEAVQSLTSTRSPGAIDFLLDLLGAALAVAVVLGSERWLGPGQGRVAGPAVVLATAMALIAAVIVLPDRAPRVGAQPTLTTGRCIDRLERPTVGAEPVLQADPGGPTVVAGSDAGLDRLVLVDLTTVQPTVTGRLAPLPLDASGLDSPPTAEQGRTFADDEDALRSSLPATTLTQALGDTQAFTIDATLRLTESDQTGPARIVTLSDGVRPGNISFQLGVHDGQLSIRVRSTCHGSNWILLDELPTTSIHIVVSYDRGRIVVFRNGNVIGRIGLVDPDLATWDPAHHLVIGNEATLNRPVRASIRCVGIHDRALPEDEALALSAQARC